MTWEARIADLGAKATPGAWDHVPGGLPTRDDDALIVALHNAWPRVRAVVAAAREVSDCLDGVAGNPCDDCVDELVEALAALDEEEA